MWTLFMALVAYLFIGRMLNSLHYFAYYIDNTIYYVDFIDNLIMAALGYGIFIATVFLIMWIWEIIKQQPDPEKLWSGTFLTKLVNVTVKMFENRTVGRQSLILLLVIFLGGFGFAVVTMSGDGEVFLFYALLFVVFFGVGD